MVLHVIQDATVWLTHASLISDAVRSFHPEVSLNHLVLAQNIPPTDLVGDLQRAFDHFVKTGQAWAFIIGLVLGYMIKTFTTFG